MTTISVEKLMREIEGAAAQAGPEPEFPHLRLQQIMPILREQQRVEPRPVLIGRTPYERIWARINRVARRWAAHAVEPAVAQQNEFNAALHETLEELIEADAALRAAVTALRAERVRASRNHSDAA